MDKGALQVYKEVICGNCQLCKGCAEKDSKITVSLAKDKNNVPIQTIGCSEYTKPVPQAC